MHILVTYATLISIPIPIPIPIAARKMLPNLKSRRITGLQLAGKHLGPVAKCPPRYSEEDWDYNNKIKFRITCDQEKLAERIVE